MQHHLLPPKAVHKAGDHRCEDCGRMVEPQKRANPKGTCKCEPYQDVNQLCCEASGIRPSSWDLAYDVHTLAKSYAAVGEIDWIESNQLRVHDGWRIAGTLTAIGFHRGRNRVFEVTADVDHEAMYLAMKLALLARSVAIDVESNTRTPDRNPGVDLGYGYVIKLPGNGEDCQILSVDIVKGWGAVNLAHSLWKVRQHPMSHFVGDRVRGGSTLEDMVQRASSITELKMLWRNANDIRPVTTVQKALFSARKRELADALEVAS